MKVNKLKVISIAVFYVVISLWSNTHCSEKKENGQHHSENPNLEVRFSDILKELKPLIIKFSVNTVQNREDLVVGWNISNVCKEWKNYFIDILQKNGNTLEKFLTFYQSNFTIKQHDRLEELKGKVYFHKEVWNFPWIWNGSWNLFQQYLLLPNLDNGIQKINTLNLWSLNIREDFCFSNDSHICSLKYFLMSSINLCNLKFNKNTSKLSIGHEALFLKKLFDDSRSSERIRSVALENFPMDAIIGVMPLLYCQQLTLIDPIGVSISV